MKIKNVYLDTSALGITSRSLKNLRNTLCKKGNVPLVVIVVPTSALTCGFVVLTKEGEAYFVGDGFRMDGAGEGGSGYRAAIKMIEEVFSLNLIEVEPILLHSRSFPSERALKEWLKEKLQKRIDTLYLTKEEFRVPFKTTPRY